MIGQADGDLMSVVVDLQRGSPKDLVGGDSQQIADDAAARAFGQARLDAGYPHAHAVAGLQGIHIPGGGRCQ